MTDLTFTQLQTSTSCPANTFSVVNGKVVADIGALIGETVDSLDDPKVSEFLYKLNKIAKDAQDTYNANGGVPLPSGSRLDIIIGPVWSNPITLNTGELVTPVQYTVKARLLINPDEVSASIA